MYRLLLLLLFPLVVGAQPFSPLEMNAVYEEVKTPYKYGLVVAPEDTHHQVDCPTVYRENGKWYMTYVVYNGKSGLDGRGYETWLAESDDLLRWTTKGRVLSYRNAGWDMNQRGGFPALIDWTWNGTYRMKKYYGRYWMTYIGGKGTGYEAVREPLNIGMAWTKDSVTMAHEWQGAEQPLLCIDDREAQWWEKLVQYKSTIYEDPSRYLGHRFVMFYNAGGVNPQNGIKAERIGIALSNNMRKWKRYAGNPVYAHETPGIITGDAQIVKMRDKFVMFYFSAFNPSRSYNAFNTFAVSRDLVHWQDWTGADLVCPTKSYDEMFAHKSYVVKHDGIVYHFYCAVNKAGQRGIAVATSVPMGKSPISFPKADYVGKRNIVPLNNDWTVVMGKTNQEAVTGKMKPLKINLPHNLDDYYGYRQMKHGNLHGSATYSKTFVQQKEVGKQYFLQLEGVGTYATVVLNGSVYPKELVGRTVFTLDVTENLRDGSNKLKIIVDHPDFQTESPWVCGGCSSEWGFSEGSQPFGIFRPVTLIATDHVRIEPFGVHVWNNTTCDSVFIDTEVRNYGHQAVEIQLVNKLNNANGQAIFRLEHPITLAPGEQKTVRQQAYVADARRWSLEDPYLYNLVSMIKRNGGKTTDEISTPYGIRQVGWPINAGGRQFLLNGKPLFINGTCDYEHIFGHSHAFSNEQIASRMKMIRQAGFNAFREAHQPHNLRFQHWMDKEGMLFWSQFSAHIWYDTPAFRKNFKTLLRRFIRERRNSPSIVLWGLQNESVLPRDFAEECTKIFREMDPTCGSQRLVTTCNGGEGTDWNVVQNWSGTYGGNPDNYDRELKQPSQLLNGEYGAWRTLGLRGEGKFTEDKACDLLEKKAMLALDAKDSVCGHFQWIFVSHENPGRVQPDESVRRIDKVGPFNYKGLLTPWEQPSDMYYMYKSHFVSAETEPFVYLVSPQKYYSNCDSVVVVQDEKRLHAIGYVQGKAVVEDAMGQTKTIIPTAADRNRSLLKPDDGYQYIYRLNCGGDAYTDSYGNLWAQDDSTWSDSWSQRFGLNPYMVSQGHIGNTIHGTKDALLFQYFRYGRHELTYHFAVPKDGDYRVELYFAEPWHGRGGGVKSDCEGLRIFDVAINGKTVVDDLDVWAEAGFAGALKKVINARSVNGKIDISFPEVKAGQAVISAIAIAGKGTTPIKRLPVLPQTFWQDQDKDTLAVYPKGLLPSDDKTYPIMRYSPMAKGLWHITPGVAREYTLRFRYKNTTGEVVKGRLKIIDSKGSMLQDRTITFPVTPNKFKTLNTTTGTQINAGHYRVQLTDAKGVELDVLEVQ